MKQGSLRDARGTLVTIGSELGRGGEGAVFDVAGHPDTVAKVYLKLPNQQHAAKLAAMAGMANPALLKIAAWPTGTLHDPSGAVAGFTMPKVGGHRPIFQLYLPKPRLQAFPKADWRFLIHAAANTARAFDTVHSTGLVIGDVNHGNLVVADNATVQMIDCDSFQISSGRETWFCTVGVGTHQPPEMQGLDSYAGIVRTPNHDNFGLAVLIFQLLCMARHPFAGRYLGRGDPPSIEEAITASKYAYSRDRSRTLMEEPPGSLPIDALTPDLQTLFEEAFAPTARNGLRPTADRWVTALGALAADLQNCRTNGSHFYRKGLSACPWCAIEASSGITLFPVIFLPGAVGSTGMVALWQEVSRIPEPPSVGLFPGPPPANGKPSPEAIAAKDKGRLLRYAAWSSLAAAVAVTAFIATPAVKSWLLPAIGVATFGLFQIETGQKNPFQRTLDRVKSDWAGLRATWISTLPGPTFSEIKLELSKFKAQYDALPTERAKRLQRLHEQRREKQLEEHLDRLLLASARISGIGSTRVATLASHGIDTAGDITANKVLAVPGFGPATLATLLAWRSQHESKFRFDSNRGVSQSDTAVIERDIATHRVRLEREVAAGLVRLKAASARALSHQMALNGRLSELTPIYARALANVAIVGFGRTRHIWLLVLSTTAISIALISAFGISTPNTHVGAKTPPPHIIARAAPQPAASNNVVTALQPLPLQASSPPEPIKTPDSGSSRLPNVLSNVAPNITNMNSGHFDSEHVVVKQAANIRSSSSNTSSVIRRAPSGIILKVFMKSAGWLQVGLDEPWGWIFSGLVEAAP